MNTKVCNARQGVLRADVRMRRCRGMSLLELALAVGIASVLFALVLGLAQHVNVIMKIRRAQAELGMWHTAIDNWFVQFGEYPAFDLSGDGAERNDGNRLCDTSGTRIPMNLSNALERACVRVADDGGDSGLVFFSSYVVGSTNTIDPWGMPYIYIPADNDSDDTIVNPRTTYQLFSCGPNGKSYVDGGGAINNGNERTTRDDVYFDN